MLIQRKDSCPISLETRRQWLNPAVKRSIVRDEKRLGRKCRKLWGFENPNGEIFLFGKFWANKECIIVTVARFVDCVNGGWLPKLDN